VSADQLDIDEIRRRALRAIAPLKPAEHAPSVQRDLFMGGRRTDAGRSLPPYYLVYFLLVDLLGFHNLGKSDKTAWTLPVDCDGTALMIEHKKFGLGVFAADLPSDEAASAKAVTCIHRAMKAARPYFEWRAAEAVRQSRLNVVNRTRPLRERLDFMLDLYDGRAAEAEARKSERVETKTAHGSTSHYPGLEARREARWAAMAAVEAFFSWTEHVFIHIAVLRGECLTGGDVARLAAAEWSVKYKAAFDLDDADDKRFHDELSTMRRQLRNFVAHGAFGKGGEAFHFHSTAGAVPVLLPHSRDRSSFRFGQGIDLRPGPSIDLIRSFMEHLWSGKRAAARVYIQDFDLPLILTHVADGTYAQAMESEEEMNDFADHLAGVMGRHMDMDF
jgi:hypothetical protein